MSFGSSDVRQFSKWFQIRWAEKLGDPNSPYLIRWTLILFGYSLRVHHWLKSDDKRYFHDHAADFISIVLKGKYENVVPIYKDLPPDTEVFLLRTFPVNNRKRIPVEGMFNSWKNFLQCFKKSIWFSNAYQRHYLDIPKEGAWTLLLEGIKYNKWGFYVPRQGEKTVRKIRPLEYFHRYGIIQTKDYQ